MELYILTEKLHTAVVDVAAEFGENFEDTISFRIRGAI